MDCPTNTCSKLPDIFEPDECSTQMMSLNVLFTGDFNVERMLETDSPAARYSRRRIASCSRYSGIDTSSTVCSQPIMSDSDFSQSEEFLLLNDECYDYPTHQPVGTFSVRRIRRHRMRRSSMGKLKTMVSGIFTNRSKSN
ncbi:hypothetical protein H4R20_000855 [Coemansia guatemalensis]|uniref:Uncharacterized protein n=1 Tax=Coemansia guatemalensis TaxID=2761395 RepID=A0A9W8I0N4_9FUNG|nr:hypothetical protein H4R20_000855 [Coemansia guatemalensis]